MVRLLVTELHIISDVPVGSSFTMSFLDWTWPLRRPTAVNFWWVLCFLPPFLKWPDHGTTWNCNPLKYLLIALFFYNRNIGPCRSRECILYDLSYCLGRPNNLKDGWVRQARPLRPLRIYAIKPAVSTGKWPQTPNPQRFSNIFRDIKINIMLPTIISYAAILIAGASQTMVHALPQSSPTSVDCTQPNHGSFTLFATRSDTGDSYPVRLLVTNTTPEGSTAILNVNTDEVSPRLSYHHEIRL
jgi:hypothetical protein